MAWIFGRNWLDLHLELGLWFHSGHHIAFRQSGFYIFSHLGRPIRAKGVVRHGVERKPGFWVRAVSLEPHLGELTYWGTRVLRNYTH